MKRSGVYLLVAIAFVAIWAIVAVIGVAFRGEATKPAEVVEAVPEPLPTEQLVERFAKDERDSGFTALRWFAAPTGVADVFASAAPQSAVVASAEPAQPPAPELEAPDVRSFGPTTRAFQNIDDGAEALAPPEVSAAPGSGAEAEPPPGPRAIDREALGAVINRLKKSDEIGLLKPEIPKEMTAFETQRVRVVLARQAAAVALLKSPDVDLDNASELPVRDFVSVKLYGGKDFKVEPIAEDASVRSLKGSDWAEWEFDLTPINGGSHNLEVIVFLYDEPAFLPIAKFSQTVTVEVPFGSRMKLLWSSFGGDWIVNLVIAPLIGAVSAFYIKEYLIRRRQVAAAKPAPATEGRTAPPPSEHFG